VTKPSDKKNGQCLLKEPNRIPTVERLGIQFNFKDLKEEFEKNILTREPIYNGSFYHGWSVLSTNGSYKDGFHHGSSVYQNMKGKTVFNKDRANEIKLIADTEYNQTTEICQGAFADLIQNLTELGFSPCRARIIGLPPGKSTDWHRDHRDGFYWIRLHTPLITNDQCFFITEHDKTHMPADGSAYLVNTAQMHMAVNEGNSSRYHFVCQVWDRQGHSKNFPYKEDHIRVF